MYDISKILSGDLKNHMLVQAYAISLSFTGVFFYKLKASKKTMTHFLARLVVWH